MLQRNTIDPTQLHIGDLISAIFKDLSPRYKGVISARPYSSSVNIQIEPLIYLFEETGQEEVPIMSIDYTPQAFDRQLRMKFIDVNLFDKSVEAPLTEILALYSGQSRVHTELHRHYFHIDE